MPSGGYKINTHATNQRLFGLGIREMSCLIDVLCLGKSAIRPCHCQHWIWVAVLATSSSPTNILFIQLSILFLLFLIFLSILFLLHLKNLFEVRSVRSWMDVCSGSSCLVYNWDCEILNQSLLDVWFDSDSWEVNSLLSRSNRNWICSKFFFSYGKNILPFFPS